MICPFCNEKNLVNSKFCEGCGKPLSDEIPSYLYPEDEDLWAKVKDFGKDIEGKITQKNYKEILSDKNNPVTNMMITFIAWILLRLIGIMPFIILVKVIAFLMHPVGLLFSLAVTYVYTIHREDIMEKYNELKEKDHTVSIKELIKDFSDKNSPSKNTENSELEPAEED